MMINSKAEYDITCLNEVSFREMLSHNETNVVVKPDSLIDSPYFLNITHTRDPRGFNEVSFFIIKSNGHSPNDQLCQATFSFNDKYTDLITVSGRLDNNTNTLDVPSDPPVKDIASIIGTFEDNLCQEIANSTGVDCERAVYTNSFTDSNLILSYKNRGYQISDEGYGLISATKKFFC